MVLNLGKYRANTSVREKTDEEIIIEDSEDKEAEIDPDSFTMEVIETILELQGLP